MTRSALQIAPEVRAELTALIDQENVPQRLLRRARVILDAADGFSNTEIANRNGIARQSVIALRQRFVERGIDAVLHDARRSGRKPKIPQNIVEAILEATTNTRPGHAAHWSVRSMAAKFNVSPATVGRIWRTHHVQPHNVEAFKFRVTTQFTAEVVDVIGVYLSPPRKVLALAVDDSESAKRDKSDCRGHGAMTLLPTLNAVDRSVIGKCLPRHRNEDFIAFLQTVDQTTSQHFDVHLIMDNYATHKYSKVLDWIARRDRYYVHFVPTGLTWLDFIGRFLAVITGKRIRRPIVKNVEQLATVIEGYIADHNSNPKKFVWHASGLCDMKQGHE